jgi:hypothetical protein
MNSFNGLAAAAASGNSGAYGVSREFGFVEKILQNYGFIKHLTKDNRMFFYYSFPLQNELQLKVGDVVEYEETVDKRNGKPLAINIVKQNGLPQQQQQQSHQHQVSLGSNEQAILNLKELLLKAESNNLSAQQASNQVYNHQEQSYQYLMKMLNIQQHQTTQQPSELGGGGGGGGGGGNAAASNLNSNLNLLSLFNKSGGSAGNSNSNNSGSLNVNGTAQQQLQQMSQFGSNDSLKTTDNLVSTEYLEGTVVNLAVKRSNAFVSFFFLISIL